MNRKFLIMIMTICALAMLVSALVLPIHVRTVGDKSHWTNFIEAGATGSFLLIFASLATLLCGGVFLRKTEWLDMSEGRHITVATLVFFIAMVYCLAILIAGQANGIGFWLYFLASLAGWGGCMLTSNPDLAKKIAAAATASDDTVKADEPKKDS